MKKYMIALSVLGLTVTDVARADNLKDSYYINFKPDSIAVGTSLGWLGGESKEYVYDPTTGQKISELIWKINNAAIIKGDINWTPLYWLTLDARGWSTLASGGSGMDDYDWISPGQAHWTNWSTSPNTRLNHANEYDVNARVWLIKRPDHKLGAVVGYQQTRFSWTAFGGHYDYDNGSDVNDLPHGQRLLGYQQKFSMPYIGLAGEYRYRNVEFNALLKFSPWVEAKDNDEHYLRDLTFREKTNSSSYYSASLGIGYYVTPNAKVFAGFTWNKYSQGKGGSQMINHANGETAYMGGDAAGIENKNYSLSAGMQYRF